VRELKFRAWIERYKKYMPVSLIHFYPISGKIDYIEVVATGGDWAKFYPEEVILEQHTGLKDKNGKEIYEGDIVTGKDHFDRDRKCIVEYSKTYCCYFITGDGWSDEYMFNLNDKEVIGNIYENEDLLNEH
jgi:uncharacterized phage protein (TIGR01671 family)